jgi:hypothetical protein
MFRNIMMVFLRVDSEGGQGESGAEHRHEDKFPHRSSFRERQPNSCPGAGSGAEGATMSRKCAKFVSKMIV